MDRFQGLSAKSRGLLKPSDQLRWIDPMLATLTDKAFSDPAWLFEPKLDGFRCLAYRYRDGIRIYSRNRQPLDNTFPEVVDELADQDTDDFIIDGEVVAFEDGRTSFARLQQRSGIKDRSLALRSPVKIQYHVFDLLRLDGYDTRDLPLTDRKRLLRKALHYDTTIHFTPHRNAKGEDYYSQACKRGWEGIIAKRCDTRYLSRRSPYWLKCKCSAEQELVIGGFTDPAGSRVGFGALLVGYYQGDELIYAGKVGTGYDTALLRSLRRRLDDLEIKGSPFAGFRRWPKGTHFVRPELVGQVAFTEWTRDGMVRQPRFLGLRDDKPAPEVVRERPLPGG